MAFSTRILVLLTFAAFESLAIEQLTNIDYIGVGYDVITGNPHGGEDPGFKQPVFELTYNTVSKTLQNQIDTKIEINLNIVNFN
jgi:hypothetical protein